MKRITTASVVFLAGCAANSGVVQIGKETYMVSRQAATGFSGSGTLKAEAFQEATTYCESQSKSLQVVSTHEAMPPYILANFPKAEIQFMCLSPNDIELSRPKLKKEADTVIEVKRDRPIKPETGVKNDLYSELLKLDDLKKRGILSEAEFDAQKKKLLSEQ